MEVRQSLVSGKGLFAKTLITKGEFIGPYVGKVVTNQVMHSQSYSTLYGIQLNEQFSIDPKGELDLACETAYINDNSDKLKINCQFRRLQKEGKDTFVGVFAT